MSGQKRLESEKKTVKNAEYLTEKEKQALNNHVQVLRNSKPISSGHTLAKHLSKLRNISRHNSWSLIKVNPDKETNKKVRNQIQNAEYKQESGDYQRKNKKDHWIAWKYWIEKFHGKDLDKVLPEASFNRDRNQVDVQADTRPEDLPTPEDMRKLLAAIRSVSDQKTGLRNAMIYMLIWDLGTRKMETFPIKMKDVDVQKDRIRIYVHGNKKSYDDWVRVFQGEQMLREYIEQHPASNDPEAYLFPKLYQNEMHDFVNPRAVKRKMRQAKSQAGLDFKTYGEPFHIFRKASTTYYVVNDILDWDGVCKRQRKEGDGTKPDYLLMAMEDVERNAAEGFGLETGDSDREGAMSGPPLLPKECEVCGRKNSCLNDSCVECGAVLPENRLPDKIPEVSEESQMKSELRQMQKQIQNKLDELQ